MHIRRRILFAVVAICPLILMQGRPDLAPAWLYEDVAGLPTVVWLAIGWFALFVGATWLPVGAGGDR